MTGQDDHDDLPAVDSRTLEAAREGCAESRLKMSRRSMIGVTTSLFTSAFLPNFAIAATDPEARFILVVLRGGMDGMSMLVPKLDSNYQTLRRQLTIPFASTLSLGADFGLHPGFSRVHAMFTAGEAAFIPAAGIPLRNRSHFECQDNLENGLPSNTSNASGWLNRFLGGLPAGDPIRVKRGLEIGEAPLVLRGPEPVLGWSPTWFSKATPANVARLRTVYSAIDTALWDSLSRGLAADELARAAGAAGGNLSGMRQAFVGAARLVRAATGPRIAVLSVEGWDMHSSSGSLRGQFFDRLSELDQALGDLKTELGPEWAKTVVMCVTEFGRTVRANGSSGTDHGIASAAVLVGGAVKSGIVGDWPGLAANQLLDGDLRPTVDLRGAFKGILRDHFGAPEAILEATVFPDSAAAPPIANLVDAPAASPRLAAAPPKPRDTTPIALYRQRYGVN